MHIAAQNGQLEVVNVLIAKGAVVDAKTKVRVAVVVGAYCCVV